MEAKLMSPAMRELASRIYVGLLGDAVVLTESSVTMTASADNLAKLSFKLAKAFEVIGDELDADSRPKNVNYQVQASDMDKWSKPDA